MREIKVRGYSSEELISESQWIEGYGVTTIEYTDETETTHLFTPYGDYMVEKESVGQYIGLKDINNKEIYEGDIIRITIDGDSRKVGEVVYKYCGFYIHIPDKHFEVYHEITDTYQVEDMGATIKLKQSFEVIGNIYENKSLLK